MSVYEEVTQAILAELERGTPPWVKDWQSHLPQNLISRREYRGVNLLLLWSQANKEGYTSPYWLTFRQAGELKGNIKKGEKATWIVYTATGKKQDENGDEEEYRFLKWYHVFNLEQTEGIPLPALEARQEEDIHEEAQAFLNALGATVILGESWPHYNMIADDIHLPHPSAFNSTASYYATSLHEHIHWSGHASRLNRYSLLHYGEREQRAAEELAAELGCAFLCSHLQIPTRLREDHAAYISGWKQLLRDDTRAIFKASSLASKAADYLREKAGEFKRQEEV